MSYGGRESSQRGYDSTEPTPGTSEAKRLHSGPDLYDFVSAFHNIKDNTINIDIPDIYLQAASVDSARLLGRGASFTASVRSLPPGPRQFENLVYTGGKWLTSTFRSAPRPAFVVYKVARVAFNDAGDPSPGYEAALQAVLTELHSLLYPPLFTHPNIIALLGLAWGSNEFNARHLQPALVVEYAEHGTLANVLTDKAALVDPVLAQSFCFDVANALDAIHRAGLIHGDIKAENVLICQGKDRLVAKLGDFGFSVVSEAEEDHVWLGGTRPWKAPETIRPIPIEKLPYADVYSLGLLIWSVSIGGLNPFNVVLEKATEESIEAFKQSEGFIASSRTSSWIFKLFVHLNGKSPQGSEITASNTTLLGQYLSSHNAVIAQELQEGSALIIRRHALLSRLDRVLSHCLVLLPESRNLAEVVQILRPGVVPAEPHISRGVNSTTVENAVDHAEKQPLNISPNQLGPKTSGPPTMLADHISWASRGYRRRWLSWQAIREQTPRMQDLIHGCLRQMTDDPSRFLLAATYISGYGCQQDISKALELLRTCADGEYSYSKAYLYRLHLACGVQHVPGYDLTRYLDPMARIGSRAALIDLQDAGLTEEAETIEDVIKQFFGGVGAHWFTDDNMLHGLVLAQWQDYDFFESKAKSVENVNEFRVNKHGDTMLHLTASCGLHKARRFLVSELGADLNSRNAAGDTPLISICRAGIAPSASVFLTLYKVDASLKAHNGETALHWLVSFRDEVIQPITRDLVAQGAKVDAVTTERVSHSHFKGTIDFDFQPPGTPLLWAVHHNRPVIVKALLALGADPEYQALGGQDSPLELAAHYHHADCLQLMVEHMERAHESSRFDQTRYGLGETIRTRFAIMYAKLLRRAIHAADTFSMMLRNGQQYRSQLYATLDIIRDITQHVSLDQDFGGQGWTPLYFAVAGGRDEVVEYMIEHRWHLKGLNQACGADLRTPLLEAVRWNRLSLVKLLIENGADVHIKACNSSDPSILDRSALHILAEEGFQDDRGMLAYLVSSGLQVDERVGGSELQTMPTLQHLTIDNKHSDDTNIQNSRGETAFGCALRSNAFSICDQLLQMGADVNSVSLKMGLVATQYPTTVLGHLIVGNARYTYDRLKYLLQLEQLHFIVEPERQLTALHRAAMGCANIKYLSGCQISKGDFDWATNQAILCQLISKYDTPEHLNAKCLISGRTALHLAVQYANVEAFETLLGAGAEYSIRDKDGNFPLSLPTGVATENNKMVTRQFDAIMRAFELQHN